MPRGLEPTRALLAREQLNGTRGCGLCEGVKRQYQPAVRVVLGYAATAKNPPEHYAAEATVALQKAVSALGRDWKRHAETFAVFPAAQSGRVVVGVASSRSPTVFDAPRTIAPNTAISAVHYVTGSGMGSAAEVDRHGNELTTDGVLRALDAALEDPAIAAIGLEIDDRSAESQSFLLSDDGRSGALVFGQALWKRGDRYEGGSVRTWSYEYEDGEGVRLVGVAYAQVDANAPIVQLTGEGREWDFEATAKSAVREVIETNAPWGWYLASESR